jgi:23S rRNA pseudouridine2605 synthase
MTDQKTEDKTAKAAAAPELEGERIAKVIARAGLCSRRDAEKLIESGRVTLNGRQVTPPAPLVTPGDTVAVDGTPLPDKEPPRLWRYHKPSGLVTSHKDPQGRPTVFDRLPGGLPRVISVGRLDLNSEGLLLLTNDGDLARELELPAQGWLRRYRVRIHGRPDPVKLAALENGVTVEGVNYGSIKAVLERQTGANAWISVSLREGKNREIRRVMEYLGMPVSRQLEPGAVEEIPGKILREQLGNSAHTPPKRQHTKAARELEAKRESNRRDAAKTGAKGRGMTRPKGRGITGGAGKKRASD